MHSVQNEKIFRHKNMLIIAVLLVASLLLLAFLVWVSNQLRDAGIEQSPSINGAYDMREVDFEHKQAHAHVGNQFYPGVYESPSGLEGAVPAVYYNLAPGVSSGMLHFNILLPNDSPVYTEFAVPGRSGKLFVNGTLVDGNLPYGRDTEGLGYTYQYKTIMTPQDNRLDIVIAAEAYDDGTFNWTYLKVSAPELQARFENRLVMLDAFYIGALAVGFALFFVLFFLMGRAPENLYFAAICLVVALRRSVLQPQLIYLAFPDFPFAVKVEHITLSLVIPFLVLYLSRVFPKLFHQYVLAGAVGCYALYTLSIALTPYSFYGSFIRGFYAITLAAMIYVFIRFFLTQRNLYPEQAIALTGLLTLFLAIGNDVCYYTGTRFPASGIGLYEIMEQAILIFVLLQMISLFLSNARQTAEARQAEQRLAAQNAALDRLDRLKAEFLSNVSHELKTPLTVMSGYAQTSGMRLAGQPENEAVADKMKIIASEADRLALMVGQILDITRIEEGRMVYDITPCRIEEIMRQAVETHFPILNKNNNKLVFDLDASLPKIMADPARITQVIVNLIANAIRFTQSGVITLSAYHVDKFVEVAVSDTGSGIEADRLPTIFERFNHAQKPGDGRDTGTGLGLFICKSIVETHGGTISAKSEAGKGTTVRFTIPVA